MSQKKPNQYSQADIDTMRSKLAELPDVTSERLQKKHVLDSLKSDINALMVDKGYTLNEVHEYLMKFGLSDVTLKDIKDLSTGRSSRKGRASPQRQPAKNNATDNHSNAPESGTQEA